MSSTEFSTSPLITPRRLKALNRAEAFALRPAWADLGVLLSDDPEDDGGIEPELDLFEVRIPGEGPLIIRYPAISAAVLFELTRHGNSIVSNKNKEGGALYAKLTFAKHAKDSMPAWRIVVNAKAGQAVYQRGEPGDSRPENLEILPSGKPKKDARVVALRHAVELAREANADASAYEANLLALLELHDELLLGRPPY